MFAHAFVVNGSSKPPSKNVPIRGLIIMMGWRIVFLIRSIPMRTGRSRMANYKTIWKKLSACRIRRNRFGCYLPRWIRMLMGVFPGTKCASPFRITISWRCTKRSGLRARQKKMVAGKDIRSDAVIKQSIDKLRSDANIDPRASPAMLNILADLMFDKIDTDNSGEIDVAELKEHYEWNGEEEKKNADEIGESAKSILAALDLNSDGKISREEMRAGFNQFNPKSLSKALGAREAFEEASNSSLKKKK